MNRKSMVACALLATLVTAGCGLIPLKPLPTAAELAAADYGAEPKGYVTIIHAYFDRVLKDPYSVHYDKITVAEKGYIYNRDIPSNDVKYGWLVYASINAKNSYGGYTGSKTYIFLFRGEEIADVKDPPSE